MDATKYNGEQQRVPMLAAAKSAYQGETSRYEIHWKENDNWSKRTKDAETKLALEKVC